MWTDKVVQELSSKTTYHREDLYKAFLKEKKDLPESAFRWILYALQKRHALFRIGYDAYVTSKPKVLPVYQPLYSEESTSLIEMLDAEYPDLAFVVFESVMLNEFLNHQIAQNTIYIQVQKDVSSYIFDSLRGKHNDGILYKPSRSDFDRYWTKDCLVVLDLISQAPVSKETPHEMTAEKMLVDIIAEKSMAAAFSPSELPFVYENILESYNVDRRRLNRYAGRRGKAEIVGKYAGGVK